MPIKMLLVLASSHQSTFQFLNFDRLRSDDVDQCFKLVAYSVPQLGPYFREALSNSEIWRWIDDCYRCKMHAHGMMSFSDI